jgi:hypothetical protein
MAGVSITIAAGFIRHRHRAGVAALDLAVADADYDPVVHRNRADTLDKVDPHDLAASAAILAVTPCALADTPERGFARLDKAEGDEILKRSGALECVAASDFADLWPE